METSVNNKCKAFTSLKQSKKLAEILPLESADMHWQDASKEYENPYGIYDRHFRLVAGNSSKIINNKCDFRKGFILPAWSLSALLSVIPKIINNETLFIETSAALWHVGYRNIYTARADNLVDACVEMIIRLHELNLL